MGRLGSNVFLVVSSRSRCVVDERFHVLCSPEHYPQVCKEALAPLLGCCWLLATYRNNQNFRGSSDDTGQVHFTWKSDGLKFYPYPGIRQACLLVFSQDCDAVRTVMQLQHKFQVHTEVCITAARARAHGQAKGMTIANSGDSRSLERFQATMKCQCRPQCGASLPLFPGQCLDASLPMRQLSQPHPQRTVLGKCR
jgi:hypothetical protein